MDVVSIVHRDQRFTTIPDTNGILVGSAVAVQAVNIALRPAIDVRRRRERA